MKSTNTTITHLQECGFTTQAKLQKLNGAVFLVITAAKILNNQALSAYIETADMTEMAELAGGDIPKSAGNKDANRVIHATDILNQQKFMFLMHYPALITDRNILKILAFKELQKDKAIEVQDFILSLQQKANTLFEEGGEDETPKLTPILIKHVKRLHLD